MVAQPCSLPRFEREVRAMESRALMVPTQARSGGGTNPRQKAQMLLVLRGKSGVFVLQLVELLVSDSGASAMRKLRERLHPRSYPCSSRLEGCRRDDRSSKAVRQRRG